MTTCLAIPHAPWVEGRKESLHRLMEVIQHVPFSVNFKIFDDREPNWSWSEKIWRWGLETGADFCVQIQDDAIIDRDFFGHLAFMLSALPGEIIGLESVIASVTTWSSTLDGLIGVGYVLPRPVLKEFLNWRTGCLRAGGHRILNEDTQLGLFAYSTGRKIWHPNPTIIDHDVSLPSTYSNDAHSHRRPFRSTVRGDPVPLDKWALGPKTSVYHHGLFYGSTPPVARHWCQNFHLSTMTERAKEHKGGLLEFGS